MTRTHEQQEGEEDTQDEVMERELAAEIITEPGEDEEEEAYEMEPMPMEEVQQEEAISDLEPSDGEVAQTIETEELDESYRRLFEATDDDEGGNDLTSGN